MSNPFKTQGMFSWFELMTTDIESAKAFYGEVFGWEYEVDNSSGMEYTMMKPSGEESPVGGMFHKKECLAPNAEQIPPHWGCYVTVKDAAATVAKVKELGGNVIVEPTEIPKVGIFSVIQDKEGAVISIIEYTCEIKEC